MGLLERLASTLAGGEDLGEQIRAGIEAAVAEGNDGNWAAAEVSLLALCEAHPSEPAVHVALAEVRRQRQDDEGAVLAFGRAVDLAPSSTEGWLGLGEALVRLGRPEPAREALRKVLARSNDPARRARAHVGRGRIAMAFGEPARAVRELRAAADLEPADYEVAHELGLALLRAQEPEAWSWLVRAAHSPTANPHWIVAAADAAPNPAEAESLLREGLASLSDSAEPRARALLQAALARRLVEAGRVEAGTRFAEAARAADPDHPLAAAALSLCLEAAGQYAEALGLAETAARLGQPEAPERLVRLALGARDPGALGRVEGIAAAQAFAVGACREADLVVLGTLAPDEESRRFVARAQAPGEVPKGNLFALLSYARTLAAANAELAPLLPDAARAVEAFDRPLLVAVMGEFNTGKSSFVNALCDERVAPVGVTPTTATINILRHGPGGGRVLYHDGRAEELSKEAITPFLNRVDDARAAGIRVVEIFVPLELLRRVEIVDTPGLNSLRPEHEAIARGFLTQADAIVWLFAVGQASKATERDALSLARAAGKRVLGVLNKADQASAEEIAETKAHVLGQLNDEIELLLPLSTRGARPGAADGGLNEVRAALEERFFSHARALKRQTALGWLRTFLVSAEAALGPTRSEAGADQHQAEPIDRTETAFRGALAAERVRLTARLEAGFRQAAAEVAELLEPRRWPFSEGRSADADWAYLLDLLEDAVFEATEVTAKEVARSTRGGPPLPVVAAVERFRAFARGIFRGGTAERILRDSAGGPGARSTVSQLQRALAAYVPDPEAELLAPLERAGLAVYAAARTRLRRERAEAEMRALLEQERLRRPLAELARAVDELAPVKIEAPAAPAVAPGPGAGEG